MTDPPQDPGAPEPADEAHDTTATALPPRPGAGSGLPRPPGAPQWLLGTPDESGNKHLADLDDPPPWVFEPPEGKGPALEVHHGDRSDALGFAGIMVVISIVLLVIEPGLVDQWWMWLFLAALTAAAMRQLSSAYLAAGADWLQKRGGHWVDTYNLTRIKVTAGNANLHIHLHDVDGRHLVLPDKVLLANPQLWDLVYNGIRHSLADGATLDGSATHNLKLPPSGS